MTRADFYRAELDAFRARRREVEDRVLRAELVTPAMVLGLESLDRTEETYRAMALRAIDDRHINA